MGKGPIHQEYISILNVYAPSTITTIYVNKNLKNQKKKYTNPQL